MQKYNIKNSVLFQRLSFPFSSPRCSDSKLFLSHFVLCVNGNIKLLLFNPKKRKHKMQKVCIHSGNRKILQAEQGQSSSTHLCRFKKRNAALNLTAVTVQQINPYRHECCHQRDHQNHLSPYRKANFLVLFHLLSSK